MGTALEWSGSLPYLRQLGLFCKVTLDCKVFRRMAKGTRLSVKPDIIA